MKEAVSVSAPGKLMLFGEHSVVYGHPCIVTAVDQRLSLDIEEVLPKSQSPTLRIDAPDVEIDGYEKPLTDLGNGEIPKGARFIEIALKNFFPKGLAFKNLEYGLRVVTKSDFKSTFGFGSSSAATVCMTMALSELFDLHLSKKELFDLSYKTVLDIQGTGSGFDVASAIYGGTIYFKNKGEVIENIAIDNLPIIVGYSGIKADTVTLIKQVAKLGIEKPEFVEEIFSEIDQIVERAKIALGNQDVEEIGDLMNQNQELLRSLIVSTEKLDAMIDAAIRAGAYGAKLSGAGGGDCIIGLSAKGREQRVKESIEKVGGEILDVTINAEGVRIEK